MVILRINLSPYYKKKSSIYRCRKYSQIFKLKAMKFLLP